MLIGEVVNKTGLSRDTIRFYEKAGLIKVGKKQRRDNNYKEYDEQIIERLQMIKRIKNFGFTLNETADVLSLVDINAASCLTVSQKIESKVLLIEQKINDLFILRNKLMNNVQTCRIGCHPIEPNGNCPIIVQISQ